VNEHVLNDHRTNIEDSPFVIEEIDCENAEIKWVSLLFLKCKVDKAVCLDILETGLDGLGNINSHNWQYHTHRWVHEVEELVT
jgi:hypothetical protein